MLNAGFSKFSIFFDQPCGEFVTFLLVRQVVGTGHHQIILVIQNLIVLITTPVVKEPSIFSNVIPKELCGLFAAIRYKSLQNGVRNLVLCTHIT